MNDDHGIPYVIRSARFLSVPFLDVEKVVSVALHQILLIR